MVKLIKVTPKDGFTLHLEYDDGEIGDVDLSDLIGKGVFSALNEAEMFQSVTIGEHGELRWTEELELCADALYLQMTGKTPKALFPNLRAQADA